MNLIKLSATSFGASIKKECLYFGKITNLESFISLAIISLCFGLQPPSFSPVNSKHGLEIFLTKVTYLFLHIFKYYINPSPC